MPRVGGYTYDLYCDHVDCPDRFYNDAATYCGYNQKEAKQLAKKAGWIFHPKGLMSCSKCRKKPKPKHSCFSEEFQNEREDNVSTDLR